jgi:hypothetical protein
LDKEQSEGSMSSVSEPNMINRETQAH